jgi:hypothetical protein
LIRGNQERFSIDRVKGLRFAIVFENFSISPLGLINKRPYAPTNENTSIAGIYPSDVAHKFAETFCASYEIALTSQFDQDPNLGAHMNITLDSPCP